MRHATTVNNPSQKPGIAKNRTVVVLVMLSQIDLGLNALKIPTGRPIIQAINKERTPISAVMGNLVPIVRRIESPLNNDSPRLQVKIFLIHSPYWTM